MMQIQGQQRELVAKGFIYQSWIHKNIGLLVAEQLSPAVPECSAEVFSALSCFTTVRQTQGSSWKQRNREGVPNCCERAAIEHKPTW